MAWWLGERLGRFPRIFPILPSLPCRHRSSTSAAHLIHKGSPNPTQRLPTLLCSPAHPGCSVLPYSTFLGGVRRHIWRYHRSQRPIAQHCKVILSPLRGTCFSTADTQGVCKSKEHGHYWNGVQILLWKFNGWKGSASLHNNNNNNKTELFITMNNHFKMWVFSTWQPIF